MQYIETRIQFEPFTVENKEIIIALLADAGYDSFDENFQYLSAYIPKNLFTENLPHETLNSVVLLFERIEISTHEVAEVNWNEEWERNFEPIIVAGRCLIRAPFHQVDTRYEHDIIIEPKMSFGTGHHATTALMIEHILNIDFKNKEVLDMGCGTGVLAILASKLGARSVVGIDIDEWAYENSIENAKRNEIENFKAFLGGVECIANQKFDVIIANINRNILLEQMSQYASAMNQGGVLLLSGFYTTDVDILIEKAGKLNFQLVAQLQNMNWAALQLILK
jgi:ribosomal protein L11 methyltransferase